MKRFDGVRLFDVEFGDGRWHDIGDGVELCYGCAECPPDEVQLRVAGPDPHGGVCDICEGSGDDIG